MHHVSLAILMSHSIHIITVFIPGNWFQQQPAFTFMYTLCKGTSSTFKFVRALTSWTAGAFIIQISQAKVQSGLISEHFSAVCGSCQLFVFCFHCACFVYQINSNKHLWRFNICTKLIWYTFNGPIQRHILQHHYPHTALPVSFVFLFCDIAIE